MFPKQYIIARDRLQIPSGYCQNRLCGWWIGTAPDLELVRLPLTQGRGGLIIGHPHDLDGTLAGDIGSDVELRLYRLAGSFVAFVEGDDGGPRLYLDASGSLPAVYAPAREIIAANPELIVGEAYSAELQEMFPIEADRYFPFTITPKKNVVRLLPNHYLSMSTMKAVRHWPLLLTEGARDPETNVAYIAERLTKALHAAVTTRPASLPLTAGYDSRSLLACLPDQRLNLTSFTSVIDRAADVDASIAERIADARGVLYRRAPFIVPTKPERDHWLASTGRCVGGRASYNFKTVADEARGRVMLMGLAGGVGRALYGSGIEKNTLVSAQLLMARLRLPFTSLSRAEADQWLGELRGFNSQQIMDLLCIEVRLGCWAGPQMVADVPATFRTIPFSQRPIFEHMLDVPIELRRREYIPKRIVELSAPELARFPYNPHKKPPLILNVLQYARRQTGKALRALQMRRT